MRRKVALTAAAVAMVGTLAVGGTLAWFTDTETATNVVTTGNVDIAWYEYGPYDEAFQKITKGNPGITFGEGENEEPVTPGATLKKEAKVGNIGKNSALIRAKIKYVAADGTELESSDITVKLTENSGWFEQSGYYYYENIVNPGTNDNPSYTNTIIDALEVSDNASADLDGIQVVLEAEAVQADNIVDYVGETPTRDEIVSAFTTAGTIGNYDNEAEEDTTINNGEVDAGQDSGDEII